MPRRRPYRLLPLAVGAPEAVPHRAESVDDRRHSTEDLPEEGASQNSEKIVR